MKGYRLLPVFLVFLLSSAVQASRLPDLGGRVDVDLPQSIQKDFIRAHTSVPLLVLNDSLKGWSSDLIADFQFSQEKNRWSFLAKTNVRLLARAIDQCLDLQKADDFWPAAILSIADIQARVGVVDDTVILELTESFGPVKELLAGCELGTRFDGGVVGPFSELGNDGLAVNSKSLVPRPLLDRIANASGDYRADIKVGESSIGGDRKTMLAPYPDLLLLLQSEKALREDPLGFFSKQMNGLEKLYFHFQSDVLVAIHGAGRGSEFRGLLPPGLAPARPKIDGSSSEDFVPLRLESDRNLHRANTLGCASDKLVQGFCGRLAMILRSEQVLAKITAEEVEQEPDLRIARWRSPTRDPGLAMLALLESFPQLAADLDKERWVQPLLNVELGKRLEAASALERYLLAGYHVIPLVAVDVVFDLAPGLKGVQIREDGIPLLWDAWWVVKADDRR